jgi:hypothetical protein
VSAAPDATECVERLLRGFRTYDRAVDVVSAFEMVFTVSKSPLPPTVAHFERFPRIRLSDGTTLTPDFTVVFTDGTGLVGEIARIARNEESVEALCSQLGRYDALTQLPGPGGTLVDASPIDVLLLVPMDVGPAAVRRVIVDRYLNGTHDYAPTVAPCIVQFAYDEGRYLFQWLPDERNGTLRDGSRAGMGGWFASNGDFRAKPERFADIKAARAFMNDPVDELYLAVHLWAKTFPTDIGEHESRPVKIIVNPADLAAELREQFGSGVRSNDAERALGLLRTAKLSEPSPEGWVVAWEELRGTGERDLAHIIATRACRPPAKGVLDRLKSADRAAQAAPSPLPSLFDELR